MDDVKEVFLPELSLSEGWILKAIFKAEKENASSPAITRAAVLAYGEEGPLYVEQIVRLKNRGLINAELGTIGADGSYSYAGPTGLTESGRRIVSTL